MGEAAEGRFLGFLLSFLTFWAAVREPKRNNKSKMLARRDGRIRAPRGSYRSSSKGQLTLLFYFSHNTCVLLLVVCLCLYLVVLYTNCVLGRAWAVISRINHELPFRDTSIHSPRCPDASVSSSERLRCVLTLGFSHGGPASQKNAKNN